MTGSGAPAPSPAPSISRGGGLARSTAAMTVLTGVSRLTGLVRIVVVGAVLGDTFLGNTYQSTNTVPNLIFELMAAGVFQAVLIPTIVRHVAAGAKEHAEHVAGAVLGVALMALSAIALVAMAASPWIAEALFSGSDPLVRDDQVRLGTIFLLLFLPQLGMYAAGMVATGVLNADDRFAIPAIAPAVNNVIVCGAYLLFWWSRAGAAPDLDLSVLQIGLLGGGTTLGVVGFCALPVLAVRRSSFRLRVRFDHRHPEVRRILRMGAWAAGFLAGTQVLILVELLIANRVAGGVVAFQIGWTFFLLPYALFAQPVLTTLFPRMSRQAAAGDDVGFISSVHRGTELICLFAIPAAVAFVAVAPAVSRAILFGAIDTDGADRIARVVAAFGPGVVGYGLLLFYARAFYARLDARTPTLVALGASTLGAVAMIATAPFPNERWQVPVLALLHAATYTAAAVAIAMALRRQAGTGDDLGLMRRLRPQLLTLVPVALIGVTAGRLVPLDSRVVALAGAVLVCALIGALHLAGTALLGGPRPGQLLQRLRTGGGS